MAAALPSGVASDCHCNGACDSCASKSTAPSSGMAGMVGGQSFFVPGMTGGKRPAPCSPAGRRLTPPILPGHATQSAPVPEAPRGQYVPSVPMQSARQPRPSIPVGFGGGGGVPSRGDIPGTGTPKFQPGVPMVQPKRPANGGGKMSVPLVPSVLLPSKDNPPVDLVRKDVPQPPVPPAIIVTQAPMPTQLQPLPGRPYCADARLAGTELCAGAQVSDQCAATLANWLSANPGVPISAFLASSSAMGELCVDEFRRLLAPAGTKASGALPNYHRNSVYGYRPSGGWAEDLARVNAMNTEQVNATLGSGYQGASSWTHGGPVDLTPPAPSTPAVDYGALVAGIGGAVGATLGGVATIVNNAQQNRLRELQIEYANNAQGAQLALQRSALEMQQQIAQLNAQNTPAAQATVAALQQQLMATQAQLATQNSSAWSTGEILAATAAGVGVLGIVGYLALRK